MKNKKFPIFIYLGIFTGAVIALFLSGKIVSYPQGTRQGGIIGGVGVLIILLVSFLIIALVAYISKTKKNTKNNLSDFNQK